MLYLFKFLSYQSLKFKCSLGNINYNSNNK